MGTYSDSQRHSDEYDPDPDYDRPTRAEAEADEAGPEEEWEQEHEGPTCIICDGVGHNYIVGWHEVPGKGTQPIIGGGTCPIEDDPRGWDPRDDGEYDPF